MTINLRHGHGFLMVFSLAVGGFSLFVCFRILGLALDFLGAIILAAPAIPRLRNFIYRFPFGPFRTARLIEDAASDVRRDESVEFNRGDPEFPDVDDVANREVDDVEKITLTPKTHESADDNDGRSVHVTASLTPSPATSTTEIRWNKQEIVNVLQQAAERRLTVAGGILLAIGFGLQFAAILLPPIRSPVADYIGVLC